MITIKVITPSGWTDVPAYTLHGCDGLAVTMCEFGRFEVTHVKSGRQLIGNFERAVNAVIHMAELSLGAKEVGIDFNLEMEPLRLSMIKSRVKCKRLMDMTIMQYLSVVKPIMGFSGEFPWESSDDSPFAKLEELKALLQEAA
ncbi:hypothetical protein CSW98_01330 [Vibrio sp. HA2012]|uniref:hypothetical protein n=1 Tax=Vibrio sp. HA2012 TaxID=1971595 RepID=UPI000C2BE8BC|nr:hypothetical protein [Vibrio sp. HA2012]PJC87797.1 hypothetical protein CSW98_01330 [Vibrio sp. HA2012]